MAKFQWLNFGGQISEDKFWRTNFGGQISVGKFEVGCQEIHL